MTDTEQDVFMHRAAHQAWKSSIIVDPVTKEVLAYTDVDRFTFSFYSSYDTHADICLKDYLTRSLKDTSFKCNCQEYANFCVKESHVQRPRMRSVREHNLLRLRDQKKAA